jgi:hypothetical protein
MPRKKTKNFDRPLSASEAKDVRLSIARAYKTLKLDAKKATAEKTQKAIQKVIDPIFLQKKKVSAKTLEDLGVNLGCLWGQTICDRLEGWEWCYATVNGNDFFAVAAPDRSILIAPMNFVFEQLQKRLPEENTSMLAFNMLVAGSYGKHKPGAYVTVG